MERLWNKNYNKVLAGNFLMFFSFQMLVPLLPIYLSDRFGANKDEIGLILAGYAISSLCIRPFSGYIVDTFDRRRVLLICYFTFAAFFSGYLLAGSLLAFSIIRILHGAPFGAATVANSTAAIDVLPSSRRAEGIGFYGLSGNLAMAIGPTIGLYLYHGTDNYLLIFWLCIITSFVGLSVMSTVHGVGYKKKEQGIGGQVVQEVQAVQAVQEVTTSKKPHPSMDRFFLTVATPQAISILCFAFSYGVVSTFIAIFAQEQLGIKGGAGLFFTLLATGLILSRFQGAHALHQGRITYNANIGVVFALVGFLLFAIASQLAYSEVNLSQITFQVLLYISAFTIGLGNGHMYPAFQNMFISMAPNSKRGTANSTILISWDTGIGLGIMLGGALSEHFGYHAAFWAAWTVNFAGFMLYLVLGKKHYLANRIQ